VIREALRLLEERDQLANLRREVNAGIVQLDQGKSRALGKTTMAHIKRAARDRLNREEAAKGKAG
jgi:Arc/MetJ-type ribon-helix-helix transcriptional regulator